MMLLHSKIKYLLRSEDIQQISESYSIFMVEYFIYIYQVIGINVGTLNATFGRKNPVFHLNLHQCDADRIISVAKREIIRVFVHSHSPGDSTCNQRNWQKKKQTLKSLFQLQIQQWGSLKRSSEEIHRFVKISSQSSSDLLFLCSPNVISLVV